MSQPHTNLPDETSNSGLTTPFAPPTPARPLPSQTLIQKFTTPQQIKQRKQKLEAKMEQVLSQQKEFDDEEDNTNSAHLFPIIESNTEHAHENTNTEQYNTLEFDQPEQEQNQQKNNTSTDFYEQKQKQFDYHVFQLENTNNSLQMQLQHAHEQLAQLQYEQSFYRQNMQQPSNYNSNFTKQLCKPDEFKGDNKSDTDTWVSQMRNYLHLLGVPPSQQVPFVSTYLKGAAATWYSTLPVTERALFVDFESLAKAILSRFRPLDIVAQARRQLIKLTQTGSVHTFNEQFMKLMQLIPTMHKAEQINCYRSKLKYEIQKTLITQEYEHLADIMNAALRTDALFYEHNIVGQRGGKNNGNKQPYLYVKPRTESINTVPVNNVSVDNNNQDQQESKYDATPAVPLNYAAPTRMDDAERQRCRDQGLCFRCRQPGHIGQHCPIFKSGPSSHRLRPSSEISSKKY